MHVDRVASGREAANFESHDQTFLVGTAGDAPDLLAASIDDRTAEALGKDSSDPVVGAA
jgi:hypothetical protein